MDQRKYPRRRGPRLVRLVDEVLCEKRNWDLRTLIAPLARFHTSLRFGQAVSKLDLDLRNFPFLAQIGKTQ